MSKEQDQMFFRNFAIVILLIMVLMFSFSILAGIIAPKNEDFVTKNTNEDNLTKLIEPVGQINTGSTAADTNETESTAAIEVATATTETTKIDGKSVYEGLCISCHGTGIPNIPQLGNVADWGPRIANGIEQLYNRAINGYIGNSGIMMPAKGGNPALADAEVQAAVDYIVANSQE